MTVFLQRERHLETSHKLVTWRLQAKMITLLFTFAVLVFKIVSVYTVI